MRKIIAQHKRLMGKYSSLPAVDTVQAQAEIALLHSLADVVPQAVGEFCKLPQQIAKANAFPVKAVDRRRWLEFMGYFLDTVTEKSNLPLSGLARANTLQVLRIFSSRIMGQFNPFSLENSATERKYPPTLYLLAPNISAFTARYDLEYSDVARWVYVHEFTHALQAAIAPWVPDFILENTTILFSQNQETESHEALQAKDRLTSVMTILEGHAEYVTDHIDKSVIPGRDEVKEALNHKRTHGHKGEKLLAKLFGFDKKVQQYRQGNHFVATVVDKIGMEGFNRVWESPAMLPSVVELAAPELWIKRVSEI